MKNSFRSLVLLFALLLSSMPVLAAERVEGEDGEVIRMSKFDEMFEFQADAALNNNWFNAIPGDAEYKLTGDYRAQLDTMLRETEKSRLHFLTRVEGFAILDEDVDVFQDRIIDIPELFLQFDEKIKDQDFSFVFGKFANRRFLDKDEITPDNYDIGERFHTGDFLNIGRRVTMGSILNTNSLINSINNTRPGDLPGATDNGSYGFLLSLKDPDGDTFKDRWGLKTIFAIVKLDTFNDTFYFGGEANKNWGWTDYPGQFTVGYLKGGATTFQVFNTPEDDAYLFYSSLVQRFKKVSTAIRWGTLNSAFLGDEFTVNNLAMSVFWEASKRDLLGSHWVHLNTFFDDEDANTRDVLAFTWRHWWKENISSTGFIEFNWDQPALTVFEDNNWSAGLNIQGNI